MFDYLLLHFSHLENLSLSVFQFSECLRRYYVLDSKGYVFVMLLIYIKAQIQH